MVDEVKVEENAEPVAETPVAEVPAEEPKVEEPVAPVEVVKPAAPVTAEEAVAHYYRHLLHRWGKSDIVTRTFVHYAAQTYGVKLGDE
jgi:hypothetical protein